MGRSPRKKSRSGPAPSPRSNSRARPTPRSGANRQQAVLQDKLIYLWRKLAAERQPPALDRFLARELGKLDGLPRSDRLWLGDLLTDAMRFGALTVFCETWRRDGWSADITPAARLLTHPLPGGPETWRRLARFPAPVVFFWTIMRKRMTGAELPAVAPPGPGAAEIWKCVRQSAADKPSLEIRALWAGLPPALCPQLKERAKQSGWSATDVRGFCDRLALRPPVGLRVLQTGQWPELQTELQTAGFKTEGQCPSVAVRGPRGVYELPAYRQGLFEIQDRASQAIGDAVVAKAGETIWDCCAGGGGKSLQLAATMHNEGDILATDLYDNKLQDLRKRAGRTGLSIIRTQVWDGKQLPAFGDKIAAQGGFDRVLVDAPCSGSGTWRRNVDGRLRFELDPMEALVSIQTQLLKLTAQAVRPGGTLVYATCSWLTVENENVISAFRRQHPTWRLSHQACHGSPRLDADTTFVAVLQRPD